jgi:phosphohistidine phosphatase SixA
MTIVPRLFFLSVTMAFAMVHGASLQGESLVTALHQGGYIILMRHARSPGETPGPGLANADNVHNERQLDETGRLSAQAMGEALRRLQIRVGQVLARPTYRALETVRLAQLGQPKTFPQLGDSSQNMQPDASGTRAPWLRMQASRVPAPGTNTVIVTHFPNIKEAFPEDAADLAEGEALIIRPSGERGASVVARVKIDEWTRLAR